MASLAVLADDDAHWRPTDFHSSLFDYEIVIRFRVVKLLDFAAYEGMLEASRNPFAQVVLAHRKARETLGYAGNGAVSKTFPIFREMLGRGWEFL